MKPLVWSSSVLLLLVMTALFVVSVWWATPQQTDERCFAETGYCIAGPIRAFWEQNGGLAVFGFPITPQQSTIVEGYELPTQWFERNRLEIHPEGVMTGRLGVERLAQQGRDWHTFQPAQHTAKCQVFTETGHAVCPPFLHMWQSNGLALDDDEAVNTAESVALFGYPLSDKQTEILSDGNTYQVQWFERARLEWHPEGEQPAVLSGLLGNEVWQAQQPTTQQTCRSAVAIPGMKLKDHALFFYDGYYYVVTIAIDREEQHQLQTDRGEYLFGYARTADFCTWETLDPALVAARTAEEEYIWAPHVIERQGTFLLFYTRVNANIAQSIALATTTNPSEPHTWQQQGIVFQPHHPGMIYPSPDAWADARDPMILPLDDEYLLYYTGRDEAGSIIGMAHSTTITGTWHDMGATLTAPPSIVPESPYVIKRGTIYYLFYNEGGEQGNGAQWRWAESPTGPWHDPVPIPIGWAHDFYFNGTEWLVSYVIGNGNAIAVVPLQWDNTTTPPTPLVSLTSFP